MSHQYFKYYTIFILQIVRQVFPQSSGSEVWGEGHPFDSFHNVLILGGEVQNMTVVAVRLGLMYEISDDKMKSVLKNRKNLLRTHKVVNMKVT